MPDPRRETTFAQALDQIESRAEFDGFYWAVHSKTLTTKEATTEDMERLEAMKLNFRRGKA